MVTCTTKAQDQILRIGPQLFRVLLMRTAQVCSAWKEILCETSASPALAQVSSTHRAAWWWRMTVRHVRFYQREQLTQAAVCGYVQSLLALDVSVTDLESDAVPVGDSLSTAPGGRYQPVTAVKLTQIFEYPLTPSDYL